jgi:subtilisin family serine protease
MGVGQRRMAAGFLASVVSVLSLAQVRHASPQPQRTGAWLTVFGADQLPSGAPEAGAVPWRRLDGSLRGIARAAVAGRPLTTDVLHALNPAIHLRLAAPSLTPEVLVDVVTDADPASTEQALQSLGMRSTARAANLIGGWLPVTALAQVAQLTGLNQIRASMPRVRAAAGPVALQGDFVQGSSALRTRYPTLTGKGVTVGILSDSFDCYKYYDANGPTKLGNGYNGYATNSFAPTLADDIASGALPSGVDVVEEADCPDYGAPQQLPFSDEGRAMAQIVYAVAPGSALAFHTASNSEADFAAGITQLQKLGANIIVDDVGYPDEPFFQDGVVAQAVTAAAAQGVAYFSAAGNDARNSYETTGPAFVAQGARSLLNFDTTGATTTTTLPITIPPVAPGEFVLLVVQWDQPYVTGAPGSPGAANTLNFCIESASPAADWVAQATGAAQMVTYPVCTGANSIGADPLLLLAVGNPANATAPTARETMNLSIQLVSGAAPARVKFLLSDNGLGATIDSFATFSPTIQGHPNAAGAVAVAAAEYYQTPACGTSPALLESYSSYGDDPILFDTSGNALATPVDRYKPDLTGPDGVNDTFLGFQVAQFPTSIPQCQNNTQYPNFFGTSAAAPHAAAGAALLWQANPALTAGQITTALEQTALPMAAGAQGSGSGFIQVDAALAAVPVGAPTLTLAPTEILLGGAATLTWASYATGTCTASGDWSGTQATSGSVQLTPTGTGALSYSLACTGPNGTGTTSMVTLTVAAAAGHHGGGGLDVTTLALLLGLLLATTWPAATWRARMNARCIPALQRHRPSRSP